MTRWVREHGFIVEATFAGKASVRAMPSTIRVVTAGGDHFGEEEAKRAINSLWYMDGHDIKDDEWEDINITLVDIPFIGFRKIMDLLTLHEVEYLWDYFCAKSEREEDDELAKDAAVDLGHAHHVMLKRKARSMGIHTTSQ